MFKPAAICLLLALCISYLPLLYQLITRPPPRDPPAKYRVIQDFFSKDLQSRIIHKFRDVAPFTTAIDDQTSKYQNFGEGKARNPDGSCPHPYLVPSGHNRSECLLVSRMDVARHQILTGGFDGVKDFFDTQATRMMIFEKYWWDALEDDDFQELITHPKFLEASKDICGKDYPSVQPYEMLLAIQTPGQTSPLHLDSSFFYGASRFLYPLWLLVVMYESGLYEELKIPQIQAVTYVHNWSEVDFDRIQEPEEFPIGGDFLWYKDGTQYDPVLVPPLSGSAVFVDGTRTVHGSNIFKPNKKFNVLDKDKPHRLRFIINSNKDINQWEIDYLNVGKENSYDNDKWIPSGIVFNETDLRMAVIFRARCFESDLQRDNFDPRKEMNGISLDTIKENLKNDLITRGIITKSKIDEMDNLDFALLLMNKYLDLPLPIKQTWIPVNFCVITKFGEPWSWFEPLLKYICT